MLVELQLDGAAAVPLKVTVLLPWFAPKLLPTIVTGVFAGPEVGDKLVMLGGGGVTVKQDPLLLERPLTVTTTLALPSAAPVGTESPMLVSPHVVGVTCVPLKVTVLLPWVAPKL